jgi:fumarate hydratase class II
MRYKKNALKMREETDALGSVFVPVECYWGAQTARSLTNFQVGEEKMAKSLIFAMVTIKKACALANNQLKLLSEKKTKAICATCDEILAGGLSDQFPLSVWQTGSGTQTNMNVNEVIASRANERLGAAKGTKFPIHANDDVNRSQSSNDVFPSAIHIAACLEITNQLLPVLFSLYKSLDACAKKFANLVKVGRTHLMDAVPITLGQEFSGYAAQVKASTASLTQSLEELRGLALGATAVGTGLNAPKHFDKLVSSLISDCCHFSFRPAKNMFAALAASDAVVTTSSALKRLACSLYKIANDIRWLASGPRCGLGEIMLAENEPGSSIMPGKVNPTQCEALLMVSMQVIGADSIISFAATQGNFELNVARPVIAHNLLQSIRLLTDAARSFDLNCVKTIRANKKRIEQLVEMSLMNATALNPIIGYDAASKIVRKAHSEGKTLKEAAIELGLLSEKEFMEIVDPAKMV